MKKLRWVMDGEFWDLDLSTPRTLDGLARPVPGVPLPLGLTRGAMLSRPKQIDFFQRFMAMPFVPSYYSSSSSAANANGGHGFSLHRVLTFPFSERWSATLLGQFNIQKFVSFIKTHGLKQPSESSWLQSLGRLLCQKSFYGLGLCSELLITPDDLLHLSLERYGDDMTPRNKAVLHHKFPNHNLTVEAAWPELFVDQIGAYWEVPFSMAIDLASVGHDSGASYHFCINQNSGTPKQLEGQQTSQVPATILPGLSIRSAYSLKRKIDIWRSEAPKLKMVQPFDIFLSNPHISASGILGAVVTACVGDNAVATRAEDESLGYRRFSLHAADMKSSLLADVFASVSFSAQHGNFQRLFLDLTRVYGRLDFPSGSKFLSGASRLAHDVYDSKPINLETVQAMCPTATLSIQQQIVGPFSFRVDSGVAFDLMNRQQPISVTDPVYAIEYALQVLGSAKAVAWYSPKQQEFMLELRFFET